MSWMVGFDVIDMSEDSRQDVEGMDASAAHVMSLLSTEPSNIKLGVVGFSMGAATTLHSASCYACGKFGNETGYPTHLDVVVSLSGWLPFERCAASLPILICHGRGDGVVQFRYGVKSAEKLTSAGFESLTFKPFNSLGHTIIPEEMDERTDIGAEGTTEGRKQNRNKSKSWKIGEIKDKEVNMEAGESDDALVCCVENTVEDRIMDSGASFHATYYKEELERFKLRSGKVRLADDKTLDIAGIGDVVLKTSFGTSWTLKDVRYIPGLKRRLISVGHLDEEGYHVGFRDQQWKVIKGSLVVAHGNKRGSLYMVEVHPEGIDAIIDGSGSAALWFGKAEESFLHNVSEDKETAETAAGVAVGLRILEEEWRGKDTSLTHLKAAAQMKCDTAFGIRRVTKLSEAKILHLWTRFMEPENDSIVAEHGLSSKITQSPSGSSDTSEGSKNSGSFEDSGRSDEEYSEDGASSKEGGSEIP
ncbi:retrovirus-related pol polyprotein from transposon TNT 1-94 [Tanacetum coccineum]